MVGSTRQRLPVNDYCIGIVGTCIARSAELIGDLLRVTTGSGVFQNRRHALVRADGDIGVAVVVRYGAHGGGTVGGCPGTDSRAHIGPAAHGNAPHAAVLLRTDQRRWHTLIRQAVYPGGRSMHTV